MVYRPSTTPDPQPWFKYHISNKNFDTSKNVLSIFKYRLQQKNTDFRKRLKYKICSKKSGFLIRKNFF